MHLSYILINSYGAFHMLAFQILQDVIPCAGFGQDKKTPFPGILPKKKQFIPH